MKNIFQIRIQLYAKKSFGAPQALLAMRTDPYFTWLLQKKPRHVRLLAHGVQTQRGYGIPVHLLTG